MNKLDKKKVVIITIIAIVAIILINVIYINKINKINNEANTQNEINEAISFENAKKLISNITFNSFYFKSPERSFYQYYDKNENVTYTKYDNSTDKINIITDEDGIYINFVKDSSNFYIKYYPQVEDEFYIDNYRVDFKQIQNQCDSITKVSEDCICTTNGKFFIKDKDVYKIEYNGVAITKQDVNFEDFRDLCIEQNKDDFVNTIWSIFDTDN